MANRSEHNAKAKEVGAFWKQGNPIIRSILKKAKKAEPDVLKDAHVLLNGCMNYFNWVDKTPWQEGIIDFYKGQHFKSSNNKLRAYTLEGLCAFVGVGVTRWRRIVDAEQGADEQVIAVMEWAQNVIYEQTFTGAAAGLLKDSIIMRKLGLADKQEKTGAGGGPIETEINVKQNALEFTEMMLRMAKRNDA